MTNISISGINVTVHRATSINNARCTSRWRGRQRPGAVSQTGSQEGVINAPSPDSTLKVTSAVVAGQSAVAGMLYLTVTAVSEVTSAGV